MTSLFIKLTATFSSDTWRLSNYFHIFDDEQFSGKDTFVNVPPSCLQQLLLERVLKTPNSTVDKLMNFNLKFVVENDDREFFVKSVIHADFGCSETVVWKHPKAVRAI